MSDNSWLDALREERESYVRAGKGDRVKQVDEQIALYGEAAEKRSGEDGAPKGRRPRGRSNTQG